MRPKRTLSQTVELPGLDICFELLVPSRGIELREPLSELGQLHWRELRRAEVRPNFVSSVSGYLGHGTFLLLPGPYRTTLG
jgi:hypothetical protein